MADAVDFWDSLAPYLSYMEDNFLNADCIHALTGVIGGPVLVVGGGQGLLVGELKEMGYAVDGVDWDIKMVEYAESRRGLKLIHGDARELPFDDKSYNTTIIATGVVDFIGDEKVVETIINEARRVTDGSGVVLVAFYRFGRASEEFLRRIGIITDDNRCRLRRMFELTRLGPIESLRTIRKETNMGILSMTGWLVKSLMSLSKEERRMGRELSKMWKQMDDPDAVIGSASETMPYREASTIKSLFDKYGIVISDTFMLDSCTVVQIDGKIAEH